jgi:hypothetical protein
MSAGSAWQCFITCPDEGSACAIAEYLRLHDCPAVVFAMAPGIELTPPVEVRVPAELVRRARYVWALAAAEPELTAGELVYLATGELLGPDADLHDDAA